MTQNLKGGIHLYLEQRDELACGLIPFPVVRKTTEEKKVTCLACLRYIELRDQEVINRGG